MKKEKEIGYAIIDVLWYDLPGFQGLWKHTNADVKDILVSEIGQISKRLSVCTSGVEIENIRKEEIVFKDRL